MESRKPDQKVDCSLNFICVQFISMFPSVPLLGYPQQEWLRYGLDVEFCGPFPQKKKP